MRLAYKAFEPGLICRGVAFKGVGQVNVTSEANCVKNGWHCAEDPADCLRYYPNFKNSVYTIVNVGGDVDEDAVDSKISCTELTILRVLEPLDYLLHILIYTCFEKLKIKVYETNLADLNGRCRRAFDDCPRRVCTDRQSQYRSLKETAADGSVA